MSAVRAVLDMKAIVGPQPAGVPLQLPLMVLDAMGNVCTDYKGDFKLAISGGGDAKSGGPRVAGGGKPVFKAVGGRALLPMLCTQVTAVTFALGADAMLDATAAAASAPLRPYRDEVEVSFCPGAVRTLQLKTATHAGEPSPAKLVAGDSVDVTVRALDAFDNLVDNVRRPQEELRFFLEVRYLLWPLTLTLSLTLTPTPTPTLTLPPTLTF